MTGQRLRSGFTTGTCGTAAAKAAAVCLLTGELRTRMEIMTPRGIIANLAVECVSRGQHAACFRVQKDGGDDPDVTNGAWVYGTVERINGGPEDVWYRSDLYPHLYLTGGEGIGMVTKPGLSCPVGKHAINPVPRAMIFGAVEEVCGQMEAADMLLIRIMIPKGVELAASTFNPKLGITGGISVLGTSGIVEPMSEQALLDTIRLEIHMKAVEGVREIILTPGNYGEDFLRRVLLLPLDQAVKCSNFVADAMGMAASEGIRKVLFVGHIGKLIKVAGGVKNTHSKYGDRRMEILADCLDDAVEQEALIVKNGLDSLREQVLGSNTTEEALDYLQSAGCLDIVMETAGKRIKQFLSQWSGEETAVEIVTFSNRHGVLHKSSDSVSLMNIYKKTEQRKEELFIYADKKM